MKKRQQVTWVWQKWRVSRFYDTYVVKQIVRHLMKLSAKQFQKKEQNVEFTETYKAFNSANQKFLFHLLIFGFN